MVAITLVYFVVDISVQQLDQTQKLFNVLLTLLQLIEWLTVTLPPIDVPELHCYLCLVWYHDRMPAPAKVKLFMSQCLIVIKRL